MAAIMSDVARTRRTALADFLHAESSGGVVLALATAVALIWANSPYGDRYAQVFDEQARHWVNDGLMAVFFLVVGLEIKRELVTGELRDRRTALLPVVAAIGGVVVPALLYLAVNAGGGDLRGWAIPTATDIAFAVAVLTALGRRVPTSLKVFVLALAIVDDLVALLVIGVAYGEFGLHPTLLGAAVGLLAPASVGERAERWLHLPTALLIVPLFALANAGVRLSWDVLSAVARDRIAVGVVLGLLLGKPLGIVAASWVAVRSGVARLPTGASWRQLIGAAQVCGIGFTVSLFVTQLAFDGPMAHTPTVAVLLGSLLSALLGTAVLVGSGSRPE